MKEKTFMKRKTPLPKQKKPKKYVGAAKAVGGVVIVASARHWRSGKPIYPVNARALAFYPGKKRAS
jgi:hypothetical protein